MIDETRGRNFTDSDIDRLVEVLIRHHPPEHACRFPGIDPYDMTESIKFYKSMNSFMSSTGGTIWKVFLTSTVGLVMIVFAIGLFTKMREWLGLDIVDKIIP